jgi:hypothetical protein
METSIKNYQEYVIIRKWIFEMLSKRKTQSSRDKIIYLMEMVYRGFIKSNLRVSQKKFLEEAAQEIFGKKLTQLYKGLDEIGIENINCLLFHEKLNKTFRIYESQDLVEPPLGHLKNEQKFDVDTLVYSK